MTEAKNFEHRGRSSTRDCIERCRNAIVDPSAHLGRSRSSSAQGSARRRSGGRSASRRSAYQCRATGERWRCGFVKRGRGYRGARGRSLAESCSRPGRRSERVALAVARPVLLVRAIGGHCRTDTTTVVVRVRLQDGRRSVRGGRDRERVGGRWYSRDEGAAQTPGRQRAGHGIVLGHGSGRREARSRGR